MNKKELNDFFMDFSPTEEQKSQVFENIIQEEYKKTHTSKRVVLLLVAALVFVIGGVTAISSALKWHDKLIEFFKPTQEQIEKLEGATDIISVTYEDNDVKVTVKQTLADRHGIYVLYEIEAPENYTFSENTRWLEERLIVDYAEEQRKPGMGGSMHSKVLSQNGNKRTVLLCRNGSGYMTDQKLKLHLTNIGFIEKKDKYEFKTEIECSFDVAWNFGYEEVGTNLSVNKSVSIAEGADNRLKTIDISPISVWIEIEGDDVSTSIQPVINFKDGEKFVIETNTDGNIYCAYTPLYGGVNTIGYYFDGIINVDEIESITVGDLTVPITSIQ